MAAGLDGCLPELHHDVGVVFDGYACRSVFKNLALLGQLLIVERPLCTGKITVLDTGGLLR